MHTRSNMTTKKTAKEKITTASTHLHKTQSVIVREPWAIGKPDEKVNLLLSWRHDHDSLRRTRHVTVLHGSSSISRLGWGSSNGISLYRTLSNTGICSRGWSASMFASSIIDLMNITSTINYITSSSFIVKFPRSAWDDWWEEVTP